MLLCKRLGTIQEIAGSSPDTANDPKREDTVRILRMKIDRALARLH